jgi:hypothetical protein
LLDFLCSIVEEKQELGGDSKVGATKQRGCRNKFHLNSCFLRGTWDGCHMNRGKVQLEALVLQHYCSVGGKRLGHQRNVLWQHQLGDLKKPSRIKPRERG